MIKIISFILFSCFVLNVQVFATDATVSQSKNTEYIYGIENDYNFEENSYNISDEQLKDIENHEKIEDDNSGFWQKIINSSHFSSNTATRTWIPINRQK